MFKGRMAGLAQRGSSVSFGEFGLRQRAALAMTVRIEAARRAMPAT